LCFPISFINSAQTPCTQIAPQNIPLPQLTMSSPPVIKQLKISHHSTPPSKESNMEPQYSIPRHSSSPTPAYYSQHQYTAPYTESLIPSIVLPKRLNLWLGDLRLFPPAMTSVRNVQQGRERGKYHSSSEKRKSLQRINMCTSRTITLTPDAFWHFVFVDIHVCTWPWTHQLSTKYPQ
jgi:hypothetical protein